MSNIMIHVPFTGESINNGGARVQAPLGAGSSAITGVASSNYENNNSSLSTPSSGDVNSRYEYTFGEDAGRYASINVDAGTTGTIVPAITNKSIEVISYTFLSNALTAVSMLSDSNYIVSGMEVVAQGGVANHGDIGLFQTNINESLNIYTNSGTINGHLTYRLK